MLDLERLAGQYGSVLWLVAVGAFAVLIVVVLRLQSTVTRLQMHYQRLTRHGGGNLEAVLERHLDIVDQSAERIAELDATCRALEESLGHAVQRVGLVRFNPFSDTGGDQSFSIALLDGRGDGIVISSLFSRTETRVFAKPIHDGTSKYNLTGEEIEAIGLANGATPAAQRG
jgi:hypothetical protein